LYQLLPDGSKIVVTPDGDFIFSRLSFENEDTITAFNVSSRWPDYGVTSLTHSPSGRIAVISLMRILGASRTRMLAAVDPVSDKVLWQEEIGTRILWSNISPTDSYIICNVGGLAPRLIATADPKVFVVLEGHKSRVEWAEFSPDDKFIATASSDQTIRIFEVPSGKPLSTYLGLGRPATSVCWGRQSSVLFASDDHGHVRQFTFPPSKKTTSISGLFGDVHGDVALSYDGSVLAASTTTNSVSIIKTAPLTINQTVTNCFQPIVIDSINNTLIAFGPTWGINKISLNQGNNELVAKPFEDDFILETWSISSCRKWLATTSPGGKISLINLITLNSDHFTDPDGMESYAISFSGDSTEIWTASTSGKLWRWTIDKPPSATLITTGLDDPQSIALSSDNRWVAISEYSDSSIRIWDRKMGNWQPSCRGHRRFVQNMIFDQSNKRLISAGADGRIISWRVPEFEEVASFSVERPTNPSGDEGIAVLRISNDESFVCALTEDGRLHIWQAASKSLFF
jgi:WD40 repeat protein